MFEYIIICDVSGCLNAPYLPFGVGVTIINICNTLECINIVCKECDKCHQHNIPSLSSSDNEFDEQYKLEQILTMDQYEYELFKHGTILDRGYSDNDSN